MGLPTIKECAESIGIEPQLWKGRCFDVASKIVSAGLMVGEDLVRIVELSAGRLREELREMRPEPSDPGPGCKD